MVMMQSAGAAVFRGWSGRTMNAVRLVVAIASLISISIKVADAQKSAHQLAGLPGRFEIALTIRRSSRSRGLMSASWRLPGVIRLETAFIRSVRWWSIT